MKSKRLSLSWPGCIVVCALAALAGGLATPVGELAAGEIAGQVDPSTTSDRSSEDADEDSAKSEPPSGTKDTPTPARSSTERKGRFGGMTLDELRKDLVADAPARIIVDPGSGDVRALIHGNIDWGLRFRGQPARLRCDRLVVVAPEGLKRSKKPAAEEGEASSDGNSTADAGSTEAGSTEAGSTDDDSARPREDLTEPAARGSEETDSDSDAEPSAKSPVAFWFYADGNVWLRLIDRDTTIEARSVYYERRENGEQMCLITGARVVTTVAGARRLSIATQRDVRHVGPGAHASRFDPDWSVSSRSTLQNLPVVLIADSLRTTDFASFSGENLKASTCDFEVPHYSISAPAGLVTPLPGGTRDVRIDFDDPRFELGGDRLVGLPSDHWDTRWNDWLPIRAVNFGNSGNYGTFGGVDWNLNFLLNLTPVARIPYLEDVLERSRLDFETTYFSRRGFGWGPKGELGIDPLDWEPNQKSEGWAYYNESRYFAIHDSGRDVTSATQFSDPDRWWGDVTHRQKIPYLGTLDVEYSEFSDRNFLREYFESIAQREKIQENLFYLRRNLGDNVALTGLAKYQGNAFQTEVERLPEVRAQVFEQEILGTGLYTDLTAQAAYFRTRPASGLSTPEREFGRFDLGSEFSYPLPWTHPWVNLRPFVMTQLSSYSELADPSRGSGDRFALGSGVTVSQQWSRAFDTQETVLDEWFGIEKLKHVVVPRATYFNRFSNDLSPTDVVGVDGVDTIDIQETVALSFRQALLSRKEKGTARQTRPLLGRRDLWLDAREYSTRMIVDSDLSLIFFPREDRDNDGDATSLLFFDNTVYPGDWISLRAWLAVDVNDGFRIDSTDVSTTVDVIRDVLTVTLGDRYTRRPGSVRGDANFIYSLATLDLGERWRVQGFWSQDIDSGRNAEISLAVARIFHRFAMVLEYSVDPGENYNQTVSINFAPASMLGDLKRGFVR